MTEMQPVAWNDAVRLIVADVDQTVCDDFVPADPEMVAELDALLDEGRSIFFVTGGPLQRLRPRLIDQLAPQHRHRVLVAHCLGAETWGFDRDGQQHAEPFYSLYDTIMTEGQKRQWRDMVGELIKTFRLSPHPVMPLPQFRAQFGDNPFDFVFEDRGPQITFEMVNAYDLSSAQRRLVAERLPDLNLEDAIDLREPIVRWIAERCQAQGLPIEPRFGGVFAVDMALAGVSKTEAVKRVLNTPAILRHIGQASLDLGDPTQFEIWGDRFDVTRGSDWMMCHALDPAVRAIDFRDEDPRTFPPGYPNIVSWPGRQHLELGTLEYLQSRHRT